MILDEYVSFIPWEIIVEPLYLNKVLWGAWILRAKTHFESPSHSCSLNSLFLYICAARCMPIPEQEKIEILLL